MHFKCSIDYCVIYFLFFYRFVMMLQFSTHKYIFILNVISKNILKIIKT